LEDEEDMEEARWLRNFVGKTGYIQMRVFQYQAREVSL